MKTLISLLLVPLISCVAFAADPPAKEAPKKEEPVKVEQAEKLIKEGVQLLDVRTKEEWDEGHLKGAKLVTVTEDGFVVKATAAIDPKKPVLVYCRSGGRSARACKQLRDAGCTLVYDMEGGITAWEKADKPVEK
jgi:rhodanese-related sulfurtransferase